jgi:DNA repair protein REV1
LTLKLMSRHPEAPIEPPKVSLSSLGSRRADDQFLGHGWCETINKSASIANKGGSATDDPVILGTESVKLLRAMKIDPVEMRGVGIQITKLDGEGGKAERMVGQGMLSFGKKRGREEVEPITPTKPVKDEAPVRTLSKSRSPSPEILEDKPEKAIEPPITRRTVSRSPEQTVQAPEQPIAGPSRLVPAVSSDGIDPDFLAALPDDLRQEVKRDHAISKARSRANSEKPITDRQPIREPERATTISPAKKGMHATAHITKQLRPKVKTQLKASAISELPLYGAWNKANGREDVVDLSTDTDDGEKIGIYFVKDLKELGIDPNFLKDLPEEMQKEVVDQEMSRRNKRTLLHRPADTHRIKPRARDSASPSRSRAGSTPIIRPIGPTIIRPAKPKLFNATTLSEVTDIITKWIDSRKGSGPAIKDAKKVEAYLVKCMRPEFGLGGMELAVEVLKFMRVTIDERWEEGIEDDVGGEWWSTWRGFRDVVDALCREAFGAGLRL